MSDRTRDARLAMLLRKLRRDANISTPRLAVLLGWSQSKVSKTELGRTLPSLDDVEAWAGATNASVEIRDEVLALADAAGNTASEWRRMLAPGRVRRQAEIQRVEAQASVIRIFAPDVIVGLAQTRPYATSMFRLGRLIEALEQEPIDRVVDARLGRQLVIDHPEKHFQFVMGETALHRKLVLPREMREQVTHLVKVAERPNIDMAVIPFNAKERVHQYHGFAILGEVGVDREVLVLVETLTRGLVLRDPDEVKQYVRHFDDLRSEGLEGEALRSFLARFAGIRRS